MSLNLESFFISSLLYVDDHRFVAIISTNEVKLVSFVIRNLRIVTKVDSIPLVDLMAGCISQKGHFCMEPTSSNLFYITSSNHIAYKRIGDNHIEELSYISDVWRIVKFSPEALIFVDSSRSCLHYLHIQQQVDQELIHLVLFVDLYSCRVYRLMMFRLQRTMNTLFLFPLLLVRLFFFRS